MSKSNYSPQRRGGKFSTTDCGKRAQVCVYGGIIIGFFLTPFTAAFMWSFLSLKSSYVVCSFIGTSIMGGKILEYSVFGLPCYNPCTCSFCSE